MSDFSHELPLLSDLYQQQASRLSALKDQISLLPQGAAIMKENDDLALLRYVLSNPETSKAADLLLKAHEWKAANPHVMEALRGRTPFPPEREARLALKAFMAIGHHGHSKQGEPIFIIRPGISNPAAVWKYVKRATVSDYVTFKNLQSLQICDILTRETGRFHKVINIVDGSHMSFSRMDRSFLGAVGEASKRGDFLTPQLLKKQVIMDPPGFFSVLFSIAKVVKSKKTLEKIHVHSNTNGKKKDASKCPAVKAEGIISTETLPSFLGGSCRCEGGCIPLFDNETKEPNTDTPAGTGGNTKSPALKDAERFDEAAGGRDETIDKAVNRILKEVHGLERKAEKATQEEEKRPIVQDTVRADISPASVPVQVSADSAVGVQDPFTEALCTFLDFDFESALDDALDGLDLDEDAALDGFLEEVEMKRRTASRGMGRDRMGREAGRGRGG
uniref:CRAL-TRIO domain-containing protein n=1 Tax=Chromera velia CCMP2878 TaxID=1169474 RepID=A0A0G4F386_9ALVE|eukprot:Cvel_14841.t1-p1 / transcript=Cvel_14841.t1 / gene=Cvel_14841 / organism=Chromera_velia_CCMP2878 / gene_product=SEC14-like protein 5, putative / transcript_product=SEC14-like protein 5, putative / location=Cvel_scaffold1072:9746-15274(-) / protein_length=446 / sequence_SO=supercontig / SO=protein_coding / is_pseudo=false